MPGLDALRGAAFLAVFLYHGLTILGDDSLMWLAAIGAGARHDAAFWAAYPLFFGWAGVPLFFVLSGFVIHWGFLCGGERFRAGAFFGRRLLRLYPAYLLALTGAVAISGETRGFGLHLFFLHNLRFDTVFSLNPSLWSLAVEAQFYALYPLFLWLRGRLRVGGAFTVIAAIGVAVRVGAGAWAASGHDPRLLIGLSTIALWGDWAVGAWAAERFFRGGKPVIGGAWATACFAAAVGATFVPFGFVASFSLFSLGFAGMIEAAVRRGNGSADAGGVLAGLGTVSYGAYLWHHPFVIWLAHRLGVEPWFAVLPFAARYLLLISAAAVPTLLLACLSWRLVETPLLAWGRRNRAGETRNDGA